jgi:hypothetical protein
MKENLLIGKEEFMKKILMLIAVFIILTCTGCKYTPSNTRQDVTATLAIGDKMVQNQPTPADIDYSLERYNLIRRAYWVNGQREKAINLPCEVTKPLGYVVLFTESGQVIGQFTVDGKVTYLDTWLTPDSEYYEQYYSSNGSSSSNEWLPDIDGTYGPKKDGVFFFTTDGKYIEWTGLYLYSDIPFEIDNTVLGGY